MEVLDKYDDDFIDAYLLNELPSEDQNNLEADMLVHPQLSEYVAFRKKLLAIISTAGKKQLLYKFKNIEEKLNEEGFFITDDEIDAYLNNTAELAVKRNIELTALRNETLQKRIEQRKVLIETIQAQGRLALQKNIAQAAKELDAEGFFEQTPTTETQKVKQKERNSRIVLLRWTAVAASLLVLVLVGRLWIYPGLGNDAPYQAFFQTPEDKLSQKIEAELSETGFGGSPAASLKTLQKGMQFYQQKQFKKSIPILKSYIKENPMASNIQEVQFYLAASYMSEKNAKEALPQLLAAAAAQPRGEFAADIQWYMALCYLQIDQTAEAVSILQSLESETKYTSQATQLLEKIGH